MERFSVIYKAPGEDAWVKTYDHQALFDLDEIQNLVEGYFERVCIGDPEHGQFNVLVNEEGRLIGQEPNIVGLVKGKYRSVLRGPVLVVGTKVDEDGLDVQMTDGEMESAMEFLKSADVRNHSDLTDLYYV